MIKRLVSLGAAALAALVGGCGDGPSSVASGYRSPATWSSFIYATSTGPLLLDLRGDPFGQGAEPLRRVATEAMAAALPGRPFALTLDAAAAARPNFRIIVVLGAPASLEARSLCEGGRVEGATVKADGGRIDLLAAFCDGQSLLSSVRGWVAKVEGVEDRRFRLLLGQITRELMGEPQ